MRSLALVVTFGVTACYAPEPRPGSPCDDTHPCASPLVCSLATATCIAPGGGDPDVDASAGDPDAPSDAIANDRPAGALDVTEGGMFSADLALATDDAPQRGCGDDGGRDVFYEVTLTTSQIYYFDTFGSSFDTTLRVYAGKPCTGLGTPTENVCNDDACGSGASQLATRLPAGTSCLVVDQNAAATTGDLALTVTPGGRDGAALAPQVSGNTCSATDRWNGGTCTEPGGKDLAYYFTVCPDATRTLSATTCTTSSSYTFDTVLYLRKAGAAQAIACNDDDDTCPARPTRLDHPDGSKLLGATIAGPALGWLVVDGFNGDNCGAFTIDSVLE